MMYHLQKQMNMAPIPIDGFHLIVIIYHKSGRKIYIFCKIVALNFGKTHDYSIIFYLANEELHMNH